MTELSSTPKRGRKLAAMLAGGLALSLLPFAAPASAQTAPRDIAPACPPAEIPSGVFEDVDPAGTHADAIDCIAAYKITLGNADGDYEPGTNVPREQMATFIARLIDSVDPDALDDTFTIESDSLFPCDVTPGSGASLNPHFVSINQLALALYDDDNDATTPEQPIVKGTGDNTDGEACFSPSEPVSREQMASFINRAESFLDVAIETDDDFFDDDSTSIHEDNINAIAAEKIVVGVSSRIYNPGGDVRRDQMASFLARKLAYLIDPEGGGLTFETPSLTSTVTLEATSVEEGDSVGGTVDTASDTRIASVAVTGDCVAADTSFDNDATNPLDFDLPIVGDDLTFDADGEATCELTFVTTFSGADADTDENTITITVTEAAAV